MATKKIKRFQEGGMSDKDRGLEASKEDKVGFFERLRMGNIDDEGSEAYRRFGAGRGKAERTPVPVEDRAATPVVRETAKLESPAAARLMAAGMAAGERQPSGDASMAEMYSGPRTKPIVADQPKPGGRKNVDVQASKPSAPAKSAPKMQEQTYRRTSGDTGEREPAYSRKLGATAEDRAIAGAAMPKTSVRRGTVEDIPLDAPRTPVTGKKADSTELGRNLANTMSALGPAKLAGIGAIGAEMRGAKGAQEAFNKAATARRTAKMRAKGDATKFVSKPKSTQKNTAKKTKKFDDEESNVEFKRGGSVSGASKRADGIATKGKTRCKMR